MSREIKFRAWHNKAKKYLENGSNRQIFSWQDEGQDLTIEQYTGLRDKNGKDIYEGDVVKWDDCSNGEYWRVAVVIWDKGFAFKIVENTLHQISCAVGQIFKLQSFIYSNDGDLEVIGNIHETPELVNA